MVRLSNGKENYLKKIFVGNLDLDITEPSLRALFEPYGSVESVHVVTDWETGRARGFAFVEMADSGHADRAIAALNGTMVGGRVLNVNEARPKVARSGRSSGGDFRGWRDRAPRW
jgi:RNA recognition motif-containing protein